MFETIRKFEQLFFAKLCAMCLGPCLQMLPWSCACAVLLRGGIQKTKPLLRGLIISNKIHSFAGTIKAMPKRAAGEGKPCSAVEPWIHLPGDESTSRLIGYTLPGESSRKPAAWRRNISCNLSRILARAGEFRLHPPSMAQ